MSHPRLRLFAMMAILTLIFVGIGWILGGYFFNDWITITLLFLILMIVLNGISYFFSSKIVLWSYRAKIVKEDKAPRLFRTVRYVAGLHNLPMPKVAIVPSKTPNAFATGRNPNNAIVAATEGLLEKLNDNELMGVISHEMAHINNRDILVMTVAATVAGAIAFMARIFVWNLFLGGGRRRGGGGGGDLIIALLVAITAPIAAIAVQLAISRSREYKADHVGAKAIGKPLYLASALEKLEKENTRKPMNHGNPSTSSLFIVNPFRGSAFFKLFATHPPIKKRVQRLRDMASGKISLY